MLVFSGEEFPEPGTQRPPQGGRARSSTRPDLPIWLTSTKKIASFPAGLNGRFHGLLTDRNRGTATLFNDRYGMHRIYYHESKDAVYFAAEAKAILAARPELRRMDPRGVGEFVSCGCTLEGRTLFEGIKVLPAASKWIFGRGATVQKETYFKPEDWENQLAWSRNSSIRKSATFSPKFASIFRWQ